MKTCHTQQDVGELTGMLANMYGAMVDVLFLQVRCYVGCTLILNTMVEHTIG